MFRIRIWIRIPVGTVCGSVYGPRNGKITKKLMFWRASCSLDGGRAYPCPLKFIMETSDKSNLNLNFKKMWIVFSNVKFFHSTGSFKNPASGSRIRIHTKARIRIQWIWIRNTSLIQVQYLSCTVPVIEILRHTIYIYVCYVQPISPYSL